MENENTELTEQLDSAETSEELDEAFGTGWEDDDPTVPGTEAEVEAAEESESEEGSADQREPESTEGEKAEGAEPAEGTEGEGGTDNGDSYTLRHLGEERTVGREEVIKLAQQGMDYQRIREKWDGVKDDIPKLRMYEGFLQELADARGGDIESLIDETRTRTLIARAKAKGETLDPARAASEAVKFRMKPAESEAAESSEDAARARWNTMVNDFFSVYGTSVKQSDIPDSVWEEAGKSGSLVGAYQRYLNKQTQEENRKLKEELQTIKQQQKNRERSTGSTRSEGAAASADSFDEGWDS